ncbi:MAG: acyl carrier protein [Bacteroidota bacterium]
MDKKPYWIGQDFEDQELFLAESAEGEVFEGWANYLKRLISSVTLISLQDLDEEQSFRNLGLDSLMILKLRNQIQNERNVKISSTAFWNYPDIKTMSSFLELTFGSSHSANSSENGHVQSDDDVNNELDQFINDLL